MVFLFSFLVLGAIVETSPRLTPPEDGNLLDRGYWFQDEYLIPSSEIQASDPATILGTACSISVRGMHNAGEFPNNSLIIDAAFQADPQFQFQSQNSLKAKTTSAFLVDITDQGYPYWLVNYDYRSSRVSFPLWLSAVTTPGPFVLIVPNDERVGACALITPALPDNGIALTSPPQPVPDGRLSLTGDDDENGGGGTLIVSRGAPISGEDRSFSRRNVENNLSAKTPSSGLKGCGIVGHRSGIAATIMAIIAALVTLMGFRRRLAYSVRTK